MTRAKVLKVIMSAVKVKICGIRSLEGAVAAVLAGADFLGFNFVPESKRYIEPEKAKRIVREMATKWSMTSVQLVGVFQNEDMERVQEIVEIVGLDLVQLHGEESLADIQAVSIPVIKRITDVVETQDFASLRREVYFLMDRVVQGEGEMVDLGRAKVIAAKHKMFLAGGLNPENVSDIVSQVRPFAVDVAGGVETEGVMDLEKIREFVRRAKGN